MKRQVVTLAATFMLSVLSAHILFAAEAQRYAAVFSDGARLEGNQLHRWNDRESVPTLEGVSLDDPGNPYNTYRHRGLPPGPISNPGRASLRAALAPAQSDYLYFVSKNDGSHAFSRTYREHVNAVNRYQRARRSGR